jgi:hypothetical protein
MELSELDALLAAAKLPETTVRVCLRGDLIAEWEELDRQLTELRNRATATLAGDPAEAVLAGRIRDLEAEMEGSTISVRLRAMERRPFRRLAEEHPARKDHQGDQALGYNQDTYFDALIAACLVEPDLDADRLAVFLDKLTDRQFSSLADAAWALNRRDISVPFSHTASRITQTSDGTSRPQSASGSATSGSLAGSRGKSRSTSTTKTAG